MRTPRNPWPALLGAVLITVAGPRAAGAGQARPFDARDGEDLAREAAAAWADDARLVWIESDEAVDGTGSAPRWGYLFYSDERDAGRVYSVRNGRIVLAAEPAFDFPAPPLADGWIDSARALAAAEADGGLRYRTDHQGHVRSMLLVRGLLDPEKPDATTWAVVYDSASASGLWIVIDAHTGKVVKTWRG